LLIGGQNYHLVHHLWPSIPSYKYQQAYYAVKPLLDEKGCHQTLGLLQWRDFLGFVYDVLVGIRFHTKPQLQETQEPSPVPSEPAIQENIAQ
jgi:beta-carotene hydroxylase